MSDSGDTVAGSITCTGSEQKLYECFNITEQNECSHAVVHCQPGIFTFACLTFKVCLTM